MTHDRNMYLRPRTHYLRHLWSVPVLLFLLTSWIAFLCYSESENLDTQTTLNDLRARSQIVVPVEKPSQASLDIEKRWLEMQAEREFPWALIFESVEGADRDNIELLEFLPEKRARRIVLRGEARDHEALGAYLEVLSSQPAFEQVHLLHLKTLPRFNLNNVGFEIKATIRK